MVLRILGLSLALSLLVFTSCGAKKNKREKAESNKESQEQMQEQVVTLADTSNAELVYELEAGACFGTCPQYHLKAYSNGILTINAIANLKIEGENYAIVDPNQVLEIYEFGVSEIDFFDLNDSYIMLGVSDLPRKTTTMYQGDFKKAVVDNAAKTPSELRQLQEKIEATISKTEWKSFPISRESK